METRHNFSRMLTMAMVIEELFTPTLNKFAVCVRCVYSINLDDNKQRKLKTVTPFLRQDINIKIQSQSWICYASVNQSSYMLQLSMQTNRKIHLWQEKAPIYTLSCSKAPETQPIELSQTPKKNQRFFQLSPTEVQRQRPQNIAYLSSFGKVSVLVQSSIP